MSPFDSGLFHIFTLAWGPGTHIQIGLAVLENWAVLPTLVGLAIHRFPLDYLYGCIAADMVFAKRMSRVRLVCHQWDTGFALLDADDKARSASFSYGYLSHLAADTVAHNKFVPMQVVESGWPVEIGHLYWEMRAERCVQANIWPVLKSVKLVDRNPHHRLLKTKLHGTLLPFETNRILFDALNTAAGIQVRIGRLIYKADSASMNANTLTSFHGDSLDRTLDLLACLSDSAVLREDPNGTRALLDAKRGRYELGNVIRSSTSKTTVKAPRILKSGPFNKTP